jgi:hypothetical protein
MPPRRGPPSSKWLAARPGQCDPDKSGSMATKVNDTVQGFNTYIAELKKEPQVDYLFSLTLFDTETVKRHVETGRCTCLGRQKLPTLRE